MGKHPKQVSKVERTTEDVAEREHELLTEVRDLAVKQFRLRLARDERPAVPEKVSQAAQDFRLQQRKVGTLTENLCEYHISAIKARAEEAAT